MDEKDLFWQDATEYLKEKLSSTLYNNWVADVYPIRISENTITIAVPNYLTKNYWEKHLAGYLLQFSHERYGVEYIPTFIKVSNNDPKNEIEQNKPTNTQIPLTIQNEHTLSSNLNPNFTFDNFVVGDGNKMATGAAYAVADKPGQTYNPFLICGGVGLGKTHLMQAIGNDILTKSPHMRVKYTTSETFMNDFINSIQNGSQENFRNMYRDIDVLLIDDIQFLSSKGKTQEEFFHTFNALYNNNKQIVLTSDRVPNKIDNLEDRLISRFNWGLMTDVTPPDLETRIAILRKKAANENLDIDANSLTYIANNVDTNVRELEGALIRVIAYATIHGKDEIDTSVAAQALQSIIGDDTEKIINVPEIIKQTSQYFNVSIEEIKGRKRTKDIVHARQVAMYLSRELTDLSFPKIGKEFGNKNHTTVIHAYEKILDSIKEDTILSSDIENLKKKLK